MPVRRRSSRRCAAAALHRPPITLSLASPTLTLTPPSPHPQPPSPSLPPQDSERRTVALCSSAAGKLNVHLISHAHDDVGWLKTVDQYYYGQRNGACLSDSHCLHVA